MRQDGEREREGWKEGKNKKKEREGRSCSWCIFIQLHLDRKQERLFRRRFVFVSISSDSAANVITIKINKASKQAHTPPLRKLCLIVVDRRTAHLKIVEPNPGCTRPPELLLVLELDMS